MPPISGHRPTNVTWSSCHGRGSRVVRSMFITCIYWCIRIGHLSIIDYNFSGLSADIDRQSTWPPMVGTPFDPRPDMGRYLSDVSRMVRRWDLSVETSGFFFYCPINYLMLPERPGYRAGTMSVRSATSPKWPTKHRKWYIVYLIGDLKHLIRGCLWTSFLTINS